LSSVPPPGDTWCAQERSNDKTDAVKIKIRELENRALVEIILRKYNPRQGGYN
jgi:hypothetical protein